MKGVVAFYVILLFVIIIVVYPADSFFEYGSHKMGEIETLRHHGKIPAFRSKYTVNVTHNRTDAEPSYTYLGVVTEGAVVISNPNVVFDPQTNMLTLHIKFPLFPMRFFANGFSMPLKSVLRMSPTIEENETQELFTDVPHFCVLCPQCCVSYNLNYTLNQSYVTRPANLPWMQ